MSLCLDSALLLQGIFGMYAAHSHFETSLTLDCNFLRFRNVWRVRVLCYTCSHRRLYHYVWSLLILGRGWWDLPFYKMSTHPNSVQLGPGICLGLLASKSSPTAFRGVFYGGAAAVGKVGAFAGTWAFPAIMSVSPMVSLVLSFQ